MSAQHTPGPWHIDSTGVCAPNGRTLISAESIGGEDEREPEANMRLIAAAPQMAEALREILAMTDEDTGKFRKRGGTYRGLVGIAARAALAAAAPACPACGALHFSCEHYE